MRGGPGTRRQLYIEVPSFAFIMLRLLPPPPPPPTTRSIPQITPAAAFPPVPPRRRGLRPRCRMRRNLQVKTRRSGENAIARRLFGLIPWFCPLREQPVAPEVNSGPRLTALRVLADITGTENHLSSTHFNRLQMGETTPQVI